MAKEGSKPFSSGLYPLPVAAPRFSATICSSLLYLPPRFPRFPNSFRRGGEMDIRLWGQIVYVRVKFLGSGVKIWQANPPSSAQVIGDLESPPPAHQTVRYRGF